MGDYQFSVSVNNSVGPVATSEFANNTKISLFCTTPTDPVVSQQSAMQDDLLIEKSAVKNPQSLSPSIELNDENNGQTKEEEIPHKVSPNNGLNGKQNEPLQTLTTVSTPLHMQQAYVPDHSVGAVSSGNVWPAGLDDGIMHGMPPHGVTVNGSIAYQNYQHSNPYSPMPAGLVQSQGQNAQQRRNISAQHNFPANVGRSMQTGPNMYMNKGYGAPWSASQAGWNPGPQQPSMPGMASWARGRSVPNMNPVQAMGNYGNITRKPPPSYNQPMMVQSPMKFRRSTSYPGKSIFPPQTAYEIEDNREVVMYPVSLSYQSYTKTIIAIFQFGIDIN